MKRKVIPALLAGALALAMSCAVHAETIDLPSGDPEAELTRIRCTCYWGDSGTASGATPYQWMLAGKEEWLGKSCVMYADAGGKPGGSLGVHEFTDTGAGIDTDGDGEGDSIRRGLSIDMFMDSEADAADFNAEYGDYVWIKMLGCGVYEEEERNGADGSKARKGSRERDGRFGGAGAATFHCCDVRGRGGLR